MSKELVIPVYGEELKEGYLSGVFNLTKENSKEEHHILKFNNFRINNTNKQLF